MTTEGVRDDTPRHRYNAALASAIEPRWQEAWEQGDVYRAPNPGEADFDASKPPLYVLDMFPYPSGAGLHVGHPLGYIATDIYARFHRMQGKNVLHAMGFDAFGLPAEQYAIDTGTHPRVTTERNVQTFRRQLRRLGLGHEARRSVSTTDRSFYKWTQWIFLQIYNSWFEPETGKARPIAELANQFASGVRSVPHQSRPWAKMSADERATLIDSHRLAYLADVDVNWCPALGTVLANEEVTADGRSERGNHPVFKRALRQWVMRITSYAERLIDDLSLVNWPEAIKLMQRNWIGRSEGAFVDFECGNRRIRVFTTRPDTLFGATYMVLSPEHPLVDALVTEKWGSTVPESWKGVFPGAADRRAAGATPAQMVDAYRAFASGRSDTDRQADQKEKTGVFLGAYAVNPLSGARVPVFIADYVLMGYGTGAIMAVPAHDERDFEFASQFALPIKDVVYPRTVLALRYFCQHAAAGEASGEGWFGVMADFLGLVTSLDADESRFAEALARVRSRPRESDREVDPRGLSVDVRAVKLDVPGSVGERRGTARVTWMEAIEDIGFSSFDELKGWFERGEFYWRTGAAFPGLGHAVNSDGLNGLATPDAKRRAAELLEQAGRGDATVQYKLRDWLFSRQRYWGEPFPIVYSADDDHHEFPLALPESALPVELPEIDEYKPVAGDDPSAPPQPPLGRAREWARLELDLGHGTYEYKRELNTMPQWAGSCWYYLRYLDPSNDGAFVGPEVERYWLGKGRRGSQALHNGVDLYVGGAEHAVLHLLYARFWHKVLFDLGHVSTPEPFARLFNQGYIQAPAFSDERGVYVEATMVVEEPSGSGKFFYEGRPVRREFGKMGKSLKNVITPDDVCAEYGADTMRLYEMYMGPLEQSKPWNPRDIVGVHRFLQRAWRLMIDEMSGAVRVSREGLDEPTRRVLHKTIDAVGREIDGLSFNTAIAKLIELTNALGKAYAYKPTPVEAARALVLMMAPLTPHIAEELWSRLRGAGLIEEGPSWSVTRQPFPKADPALLVEDSVELPVQIAGKIKARITVAASADEAFVRAAALADERVQAALVGKSVQKVIVVQGRMVNIVAS